MKNLIIILIAISSFTIFYQCTKENSFIENKTELIKSHKNLEINRFIDFIKSNGIYIITDDNVLKSRSTLSGYCFRPQDSCYKYTITDTISISLYCNPLYVRVHYDVWQCPGDPNYYFNNFIADPISTCAYLDSLIYNSDGSALALIFDRIDYQASLIVEQEFMTLVTQYYNPQCPDNRIEAHFYTNLCYQWCMEMIGNPRPPDPAYFVMSKAFCGEKCCKRERKYCMNNGVVMISSPTFQTLDYGECGSSPSNPEECDGRLVGSCERTCGVP